MNERSVFLAVLDIADPSERSAYLDRACAGDTALRAGVEALLKAHQEPGSFMERPAAALVATVDESPLSERPGTVIGPYKLLEQIGEGGFAIVFLAEQQVPVCRKVALKVLKPGMDSKQVIARFEAERQALALMDHPNIAHILDASTTEQGRPYFVMELVRGVPITEFCDLNHLPVRRRLELFVSVCQAVQHAHHKGVIHRDLKPSNVLVTLHDDKPVVKVIDFGIAKAAGQRLTDKTLFTNFTQMIGTPLYMSPEQAQMSALDVDTRSDIYSLGVLLYELLTGTTPFEAERLRTAGYDEIRRIIREEEPARPSARVSTLGQASATISANRGSGPRELSALFRGELDWVVMKALEKDRNRRYESAGAFAADVERYLKDEPVQACPPSAWYRFRKFARRHKAALAATAAMAAALLLAVGSLVAAVSVLAASNTEVREKQGQTQEALERERQAKDELQQSLCYQRIALAERELAANNLGHAGELLAECPPHLRGWEWHYLKRLPYDPPRVLRDGKAWLMGLAYGSDGRYLATSNIGRLFRSDIHVWEAATGKVKFTLGGHVGLALGLAFSPDGGQLATGGMDKTILLWDMTTGKTIRPLRGHGGPVTNVAYSPDGKHLASASHDGTARVWDTSTGAEILRFQGHGALVSCLAYSPDGRRLASWGMDFHVRLWDAVTGQEQRQMAGHAGRVFRLAFHPDGRHLVSTGSDGLRLWDVETGRETLALKGINSSSLDAVFSPDGRRLVSAGWDHTVKIWDWQSAQEVLALRGHSDFLTGVAFSGDGRRLASASIDGSVRLWDATPLDEAPPPGPRRLQGHRDQVLGLAFSPDQRLLATASMDGTAKLWEVASGKLLHTLAGHDTMVTSIAFHGGGELLSTVTVDGTLVQWEAATGQRRRTLQGLLGPILNTGFNVAFRANGEQFTSVVKDMTIRVWETQSGREIDRAPEPLLPALTSCLSPDGKHLAIAAVGSIQVVEVQTHKQVAVLPPILHMVHQLTFSADGQRLAAAAWDGSVRVWDVKTQKTLHTFRHSDRVMCVAFHPNGRQLASGSCDNTAKVWDLETGREMETLRGHIGYVTAVAYSGDGKRLATASGHRYQGEVQLWDTAAFGKKR
jgi:WD40 repeat protein/serine/threonine protein kinase